MHNDSTAYFIPLLFYILKVYKGMAHIDTGKKIWRFLWTIPATFYLFWYHGLYLVQNHQLS